MNVWAQRLQQRCNMLAHIYSLSASAYGTGVGMVSELVNVDLKESMFEREQDLELLAKHMQESQFARSQAMSLNEVKFKESVFQRTNELDWRKFGYAAADAISNSIVAQANAKRGAMMQNLETLRDAVSIFSSAPSATQTIASPFTAVANSVGLVGNTAGTIINAVMALK